jgi:hypothetical protein
MYGLTAFRRYNDNKWRVWDPENTWIIVKEANLKIAWMLNTQSEENFYNRVKNPTPAVKPTPAVTPTPAVMPTPAVTSTPAVTPTHALTPTPAVTSTPAVTATPAVAPTLSVMPTPIQPKKKVSNPIPS